MDTNAHGARQSGHDLAAHPHLPQHTSDRWAPPPSAATRLEAGRKLRRQLPRRALGTLSTHDRDPLGILAKQNAGRLQELVPLRTERMSASAFAFYRGTAAIMAADLAADEHSGILVPSCGDAHLANFGFYASPQQTLVFDLNDFDEAAWGPWEWDLKRLVASIVIAGAASSRDEAATTAAVLSAVRSYGFTLRASARLSPRERYFTHFDADAGIDSMPESARRVLRQAIKQARKRTGERAARKLAAADEHGRLRFVLQPPTMLEPEPDVRARVHRFFHRYLESANADIRLLLRNYVVADVARRVVGVGSVGTRCALTLLQDGDGNTLVMQSKEAVRSSIEQYGGIVQPHVLADVIAERGEGARVVALQRILQAVSDPFLGYLQGDGFDLYVRQFHDMKGGIDAESLEDEPFRTYAQACAVTLARAHSQSPLSVMISGYVGSGRVLGEVLLEWAHGYAALSQRDFRTFVAAQSESTD